MASFCAILFPTRCLGQDLGLESVSEGFPTYSYIHPIFRTINWIHTKLALNQHWGRVHNYLDFGDPV